MKITAIDTTLLAVPTLPPMARNYPVQKLVVAEIATDAGHSGLGYSLVFGGGGADAVLIYAERLKGLLLGEDPRDVERLWEKMFRADMGMKKHGVAAYALSALDIGLWDLAGKIAGLPLYRMWGAASERIEAYGSGGWSAYSIEDIVAEMEHYAAMGCRYYKMKIHDPDPRVNRRRVDAVLAAANGRLRLMVDVNQKLDVPASVRQARMLEDFDLVWYEEPVIADDISGCAEVAAAIRIPVATGENAYTRWEFRDLIEKKAAQILMPDVCRANGFTETLRIGRLAAAHSLRVSPHVVHELSLHVAGALPNAFLVEFIDWAPKNLFAGMPACVDGHFGIPDRPGHGISLAPDALEHYRHA